MFVSWPTVLECLCEGSRVQGGVGWRGSDEGLEVWKLRMLCMQRLNSQNSSQQPADRDKRFLSLHFVAMGNLSADQYDVHGLGQSRELASITIVRSKDMFLVFKGG